MTDRLPVQTTQTIHSTRGKVGEVHRQSVE